MPAPRPRRRQRVGYLFQERRLLLDEEERSTGATDGRLVVDEGLAGNADRLLDRLRAVHGGPV